MRKTPEASGVFLMERVTRIELALSAWEADVLPLNYTRGRIPVCITLAHQRPKPPVEQSRPPRLTRRQALRSLYR